MHTNIGPFCLSSNLIILPCDGTLLKCAGSLCFHVYSFTAFECIYKTSFSGEIISGGLIYTQLKQVLIKIFSVY